MSPYLAELVVPAPALRAAAGPATRPTTSTPTTFPVVVNCTGPAPVPTRGWNPLVDTLLDRGAIRPHRLGLGLDLDEHGRVVDAAGEVDPDVFVVGRGPQGLEWEVSAIPDLRGQAVQARRAAGPPGERRAGRRGHRGWRRPADAQDGR